MTHPLLERNEVIALINLLERLSHSIEIVQDMYQQLQSAAATSSGASSSSSIGTGSSNILQGLTGHLHDAL